VSKRKRPQSLRHLILASLIIEPNMHGYGIYKKISYIAQAPWKPSIGTIYRVLNELVSEGLIVREEKPEASRRRIIYRISEKGVDAFLKETKAPLTKLSGTVATILEAYIKLSDRVGLGVDPDLRERLIKLRDILMVCESKKLL